MRLQNSGHNCIAGQVVHPQLGLAAARRVPRRAAHGVRRGAPRVRSGTRAATRSSRPRHPTIRTRRGPPTAPGRSSRSARTTTRRRSRRRSTSRPCSASSSLPGNGQEFLDARRRARQRPAHRHARRERPHRPGDAGRARRRLRAGDRRPALRRDRDQRLDGLRLPHADADLGRLPRRARSTTSRAASASSTTRCCSTASSARSTRGPFRPFPRSVHARSPAKRNVLGAAEAAVVRDLPHRRGGERGLHPIPDGRQLGASSWARSRRRSAREPRGDRTTRLDRRLHHRRSGLGRRRARGAAERGSGGHRCCCSRPAGPTRRSSCTCRPRSRSSSAARTTGTTTRCRSRRSRIARSSGRAARRSAGRRRSTR